MISKLTIEGFRCFDRLEMGGLGRVNLIVGKNNSGKTSVLEALFLAGNGGRPSSVIEVLWRRGERLPESAALLDVSCLFKRGRMSFPHKSGPPPGYPFRNRQLAQFRVSLGHDGSAKTIGFTTEAIPRPNPSHVGTDSVLLVDDLGPSRTSLERIRLARGAGYVGRGLQFERSERSTIPDLDKSKGGALLVGPETVSGLRLIEMWDAVVLTDGEALVHSALQSLDPTIERIAAQVAAREHFGVTRGGFLVKRVDSDGPVPIGSLGDGIWRMLTLAVFMSHAQSGLLLVDEIDSGLHYTALVDMWKLVFQAAKEADVQVFATTHSFDCINSFAELTRLTDDNNRVSLQRVEAGNPKAVSYTEGQIRVVAGDPVEAR